MKKRHLYKLIGILISRANGGMHPCFYFMFVFAHSFDIKKKYVVTGNYLRKLCPQRWSFPEDAQTFFLQFDKVYLSVQAIHWPRSKPNSRTSSWCSYTRRKLAPVHGSVVRWHRMHNCFGDQKVSCSCWDETPSFCRKIDLKKANVKKTYLLENLIRRINVTHMYLHRWESFFQEHMFWPKFILLYLTEMRSLPSDQLFFCQFH